MEIDLHKHAIEDLAYWKKSGNKVIQNKIPELFTDMKKHPVEGIGKPELLKYELAP